MMVSTTVLVFGLGASMVAMNQAVVMIDSTRNQQTALHTARNVMEAARTLPFDDDGLRAGKYFINHPDFSGRIRIRDVDASTKDVNVRINYDSRRLSRSGRVILQAKIVRTLHP